MRGSICLFVLVPALLAGGCVFTPAPLRGTFADIQPSQASIDKFSGTEVRWGGVVVGQRLTDLGECLEIAAYPLDRWTLQPTVWNRRGTRQPRFLACGTQIGTDEIRASNGTVTAVGSIQSANVYQVALGYCLGTAAYARTAHANNADTCVISLPVLKITAIHVWPTLPSTARNFTAMPGNTTSW